MDPSSTSEVVSSAAHALYWARVLTFTKKYGFNGVLVLIVLWSTGGLAQLQSTGCGF